MDSLQNALVVANTGLCVTTGKAVRVSGDCSKNIRAVEESLRELGDGEWWDGGCVIHGIRKLSSAVAYASSSNVRNKFG